MDPAGVLLQQAYTGLVFLVMITVLVAVHELGHFLAARAYGMHVEAFAVMMGGVRRTDLTPYLDKPIVPARTVWLAGLGAAGVVLAGVLSHQAVLLNVGLVLLGIGMPIWVATRLEALYHLDKGSGVRTLFAAWLVGLGLYAFATRLQNVMPSQVLGLLSIFGLIGLAIVYYAPLRNKAEDSPQGAGHIVNPANGQAVPVQFRPLLWTKDKQGTEFSLLLLPLGGFAAIKGMHPKEDGSEVYIEKGFYSKSPFARFVVLAAGPAFSILFGVLVLAGLFAWRGEEKPVNEPVVGQVAPGGPADKAGVKAGDRVVEIDGRPINAFYDMVSYVRDSYTQGPEGPVGRRLLLVIDRDGQRLEIPVTPSVDPKPSPVLGPDLELTDEQRVQAKLQMSPKTELVPMTPAAALAKAAIQPVELAAGLTKIASNPATAGEAIGGPGTIVQQTSLAAKGGIATILLLSGLLSISLGVLNLLPIPPMDGGQMVVAVVEMLRGGRRLSIRVQHTLQTVGMFLILVLALTAITVDIGRFAGR